jgi:hypothetical protein
MFLAFVCVEMIASSGHHIQSVERMGYGRVAALIISVHSIALIHLILITKIAKGA